MSLREGAVEKIGNVGESKELEHQTDCSVLETLRRFE